MNLTKPLPFRVQAKCHKSKGRSCTYYISLVLGETFNRCFYNVPFSLMKDLPTPEEFKQKKLRILPLEFEKDDDSNGHIDFIVGKWIDFIVVVKVYHVFGYKKKVLSRPAFFKLSYDYTESDRYYRGKIFDFVLVVAFCYHVLPSTSNLKPFIN